MDFIILESDHCDTPTLNSYQLTTQIGTNLIRTVVHFRGQDLKNSSNSEKA